MKYEKPIFWGNYLGLLFVVGLLFGVVANAQVQALSEAEKKEEEEAFKI